DAKAPRRWRGRFRGSPRSRERHTLKASWRILVSSLARSLAVALILGAALLGIGALFHPMLASDAADQLRTIAATSYWRALHLAMLAGAGLVIAGIWVRLVSDRAASGALVAALAIVSLGVALNALNIA